MFYLSKTQKCDIFREIILLYEQNKLKIELTFLF